VSTFPDQQQRETEQVTGTITGIVQKGPDKWQVVVVPDGSQNSKNLWTKDQQVVGSLSTMIGQRMAFACNVSHWLHQATQQMNRSLWIEAVGPSAVGSPALAGPPLQQQPQPVVVQPQVMPMQAPAVNQDVKEQRIHRQTASKVAAIMLTHVQPEERTMSTLFVLAERLVAYYNDGLPAPETLDDLMHRAMPQGIDGDAARGVGYDNTPPDDIPF
jgi:hypothetical protein